MTHDLLPKTIISFFLHLLKFKNVRKKYLEILTKKIEKEQFFLLKNKKKLFQIQI